MSFIDFGTAVDLGSQIDFGFTRGSGFSPPSGAFGFGSQPTPTNQGGGLFGNLFGGGSQGALTATLGGLTQPLPLMLQIVQQMLPLQLLKDN
jgi:hypothetical protein